MNTYVDESNSMEQMTNVTKPILTGLVLGGLIGAAAMLLFAPQSGQKTRTEIRHGAIELRDRATATVNDAVAQVKSRTNEITSSAMEKADELKHRGQNLLVRQLDRVSYAAEAGKKAIEEA
jgi:gas vesicle protein